MAYRHRWLNGEATGFPNGKVVCVGRNYAAHAIELGNAVPDSPILFMKPASALTDLEAPIRLPKDAGPCHFETEVALLIGQSIKNVTPEAACQAVAGVGLALDLTLRELQAELKVAGHPWERAKAFDGACPVSGMQPTQGLPVDAVYSLHARVNGELRQQGNTTQMLFPLPQLLAYMSNWFTLAPGDLVLTGTPEGVGPRCTGDELQLGLEGIAEFRARVA